jgi:hypothetical protein
VKEPKRILEEIENRILELKGLEEEYKKKNNVSGRLNVKTRREELQRLKTLMHETQEA